MTEGNNTPVTRVLVVDDELPHALLISRAVLQLGYAAEIATNGPEALNSLRASLSDPLGSFALLITDLHLDGAGGIGLLRDALKVDETLAVVFVTAYGSVDTAVEALRNGATDYIEKPVRAPTLGLILSKALAARRLKRENAILQARIRELQAANIELEAFARAVSHDVRSPLHAMMGFAELLQSETPGLLNPTQKQYLSEIYLGGRQLEHLTRDLREFAQLGCGSLAKVPVEVTHIVIEVIEELHRHDPGRQVQIDLGHLPEVMADRTLLRQVFFNILDNAFKFSADREVARIEVNGAKESGWCTYEVCDNGVGFDQHEAASSFASFSRPHPGEQFNSTGVGLWVLRRIVERHQGRVVARGEAGRGACVRISLPC